VLFLSALSAALEVNPGMLILWGLVLLAFSFFACPYVRSWMMTRDQNIQDTSEDPEDVEYENALEAKGALVIGAHLQLSNIRFQQSFTSGWSGSLKLPVTLEGSMKSYKQVLICIDELDKLESDEAAQRFLNGIKSVFNQTRCSYLVSVSEKRHEQLRASRTADPRRL
jgi:hypothetical protein